MSEPKILVPLATGFEEVEAVTIIDCLRRAELEVASASLGQREVTGAHGIRVMADCTWDELDEASITALVLPGGMPGTSSLREDRRVIRLLQRLASEGQLTAAICAAPMVLGRAGLLAEEREYTCYPGMDDYFREFGPRSEERLVRSGTVLTSQGPATAMEFALAVVDSLVGPERAAAVAEGLLVSPLG